MNIPAEILDRLKQLPVEQVAEALGIHVRRHSALCFIHEDHHPSLAFSPRYNNWRCYACGERGDVISLVQKKLGLDFLDACRWLAVEFGVSGFRFQVPGSQKAPRQVKPVEMEEEFAYDEEMLRYVLEISKLTPLACRFLYFDRRYTMQAVLGAKVGAVRWGKELADALVEKFGEERALASGLVMKRKEQFYSYFHSPSLLFPYFDKDGRLLGIQARYLGKVEAYPRFQFTRGQRVPIFNLPVLNTMCEGDELYVAEGVTDCLALLSEGKKAVAIPSATLLKAKDLQMLSHYRLMMYPDNDAPGEKLFTAIQDGVTSYGGTIRRLELPKGVKDYSEWHWKKGCCLGKPRVK